MMSCLLALVALGNSCVCTTPNLLYRTCAHVYLCVSLQVTQYSHGSIDLLGIQIDAAINGGNSGGPVFNKRGQCCGIAFQVCWGCGCLGVVGVRVICHGCSDVCRECCGLLLA